MEVKVGQWVRGTHQFINDIPRIRFIKVDKITEIFDVLHYIGKHKDAPYKKNMHIRKEDIISVADTPQELVQEGDLVEIKGFIGLHYVYNYGNNEEYRIGNNIGMLKNIKDRVIKILTPNSNGGYDLQWGLENNELKARNQD